MLRISLPVEQAFARFFQHVWSCQTCTAGLCLAAASRSRSRPDLCPKGRTYLTAVRRLWNPAQPIRMCSGRIHVTAIKDRPP